MTVDVLCANRDAVGESPLWNVAEQSLYWVDIDGRALNRWRSRDGAFLRWATPERLGCIALHAHGGLVAGMESGLFHLHPQADGSLASRPIADLPHARAGMRANDGRCDRNGRFWFGTMVMDMSLAAADGVLRRLDGHGLSAPLVDGLVTANGIAFSPDGSTMYLSDSHPTVQRIWAFDLGADGVPANRRLFVDMNAYPGRPDGAAVDVDGCYWTCANDAALVHRFTPDGRLDRSLMVPAGKPSMCAFGGARMDELYITSIVPARPLPGHDASLAGAVFVTRPGVAGIAETPFLP